MKKSLWVVAAAIVTIFTQCDTVRNLPTNTSGGVFSLNGAWQLTTTSDNKALEGSIVQVIPGIADGTARTLNNNTYCARERDALWRGLKNTGSGTFSLQVLVNACEGTVLYKPATLTVLTSDEIRITGSTALSGELVQTWRRTTVQ